MLTNNTSKTKSAYAVTTKQSNSSPPTSTNTHKSSQSKNSSSTTRYVGFWLMITLATMQPSSPSAHLNSRRPNAKTTSMFKDSWGTCGKGLKKNEIYFKYISNWFFNQFPTFFLPEYTLLAYKTSTSFLSLCWNSDGYISLCHVNWQ